MSDDYDNEYGDVVFDDKPSEPLPPEHVHLTCYGCDSKSSLAIKDGDFAVLGRCWCGSERFIARHGQNTTLAKAGGQIRVRAGEMLFVDAW